MSAEEADTTDPTDAEAPVGPNKYNVGDETPKGVVTCVMTSRHPKASKYLMRGGEQYSEWEIDGVEQPPPNTRFRGPAEAYL